MDFDTFCKSDFRVVKVKACEAVKKSKKLLKFTLDDGSGTDRQILSGIAMYYKPEDLVGKTLVAIVNLPPRKMMGQESQGMLLSAVHKENDEERLNLVMLNDARRREALLNNRSQKLRQDTPPCRSFFLVFWILLYRARQRCKQYLTQEKGGFYEKR